MYLVVDHRLMAILLTLFELGFLVFYGLMTVATLRGWRRTQDRTTRAMFLISVGRILATIWMIGMYRYAYAQPSSTGLTWLLSTKLPLDLYLAGAITDFMWPQITGFFGWQTDKKD